jgi:nucleoside-diphosphate-sugar epimerase
VSPPITVRSLHKLITAFLVTGGLGGVGSEVVTAILESGGDVICFDLPREANVGEFPLQPDIAPRNLNR